MTLRRTGSLIAAAFAIAIAGAQPANASHDNIVGPIDAIDGVFGSGGGSFGPTVLGAGGTDWYAFAGNAGDNISIDVFTGGDSVVALFRAVGNGIVQVGDDPLCSGSIGDTDCGGQGAGHDLLWQAFDDDGGVSLASHLDFALTVSGQYAIVVQEFNKDDDLAYIVALSGNTAAIDGQVPEPGTMAVFGLGLAGLAAFRRRR